MVTESQETKAAAEDVTKEFGPVSLDPLSEIQCRNRLREYLAALNQASIEKNVEELVSFDIACGTASRFEYFLSKAPKTVLSRLLISGCAVGAEHLIARNHFGFQDVTGTEVVEEFVTIAKNRLSGLPGFHVDFYDGLHLPYKDHSFMAVASGHIIEHTPSPLEYLREHMRVLAPGGYMFLEFPDRYHPIELHTNTHSMEFLDDPLREIILTYMASPQSPFPVEKRRMFDLVRRTLKPISVDLIKKYLESIDPENSRVLHHYEPVSGYRRLIIEKSAPQ